MGTLNSQHLRSCFYMLAKEQIMNLSQSRHVPTEYLTRIVISRWASLNARASFVINVDEAQCLRALALNHEDDEVALLLLRKLSLARLVDLLPPEVVGLGSIVRYTFGESQIRRLRLVHPHAVRHASDLSVASRIGAGLVGLQIGHKTLWPDEAGRLLELRAISVHSTHSEILPAHLSGEF